MTEKGFHFFFGDVYRAKHPHVEWEVIEYPDENDLKKGVDYIDAVIALVDTHQPDLIFLTSTIYRKLDEQNKLRDLTPFMQDEKFHLEEMHAGIVAKTRDQGQGKLGIVPTSFNNYGLFYNKKLFREWGIPLPKKDITWEDFFNLMKRFPDKDSKGQKIYPYADPEFIVDNSACDWMEEVLITEEIRIISSDFKKVDLHGNRWREILEMMIHQTKTGFLKDYYQARPSYLAFKNKDAFTEGQSVTTMNRARYLDALHKKENALEWGVMRTPINPTKPKDAANMYCTEMIGVHKNSKSVEEVENFLLFATSFEEGQRRLQQTHMYLPVRTPKNVQGTALAPFYAANPGDTSTLNFYAQIPTNFKNEYREIFEEEFQNLLANKITTDEFIDHVEKQAQMLLDKCTLVKTEEEKIGNEKPSEK